MKVTHNGKELFEVVIPDKIPDEIEIMNIGTDHSWGLLAVAIILSGKNTIVNEQNMQEFLDEYNKYKAEFEKGDRK